MRVGMMRGWGLRAVDGGGGGGGAASGVGVDCGC